MLWWGCFEIPTPKTLENMQKNVFSAVLIPDWKFLCRYFTGSAQKRKDILRFWNFPEVSTNVCLSYVTSLQSKIPYFNFVKLGNLYIMKANVRHQQKAIFSIKKYLLLQSIWYLAVLRTLNTHDEVILTLSYLENIIFLKKIHF